jgi:hypothetical protein
MSASTAPTYYFTGIKFNAAYFATSNSALTQTQADALYLLKRTADTATALESFTGGILVNSVSPTTNATVMNIGATSTADINIGTAVRGTSAVIHIGDANSNTAGSNVHINNGTNTASNVQILNGTGSTGIITLGSSTSTTNCNCPLTLLYAPSLLTGTNDLGYRIVGTQNNTSTGAGATNIYTFTLTAGIWLVVGNIRFATPGTFSVSSISITSSANEDPYTVTSNYGNGSTLAPTRIINTNSTGLGPYYLVAQTQIVSVVSVSFNCYRIA